MVWLSVLVERMGVGDGQDLGSLECLGWSFVSSGLGQRLGWRWVMDNEVIFVVVLCELVGCCLEVGGWILI